MSINKVILVGRISNDITINKSQSGTSMCNFSIAVDRYMGKDKEKATDFIRCTAFGSTADILGKYAGKGKQVAVEGNIKTGSYEKDGVKSITVRLNFAAMDRTLEMDEVQGWINTVLENLSKIGVALRA